MYHQSGDNFGTWERYLRSVTLAARIRLLELAARLVGEKGRGWGVAR
jgi:hypothetical protein